MSALREGRMPNLNQGIRGGFTFSDDIKDDESEEVHIQSNMDLMSQKLNTFQQQRSHVKSLPAIPKPKVQNQNQNQREFAESRMKDKLMHTAKMIENLHKAKSTIINNRDKIKNRFLYQEDCNYSQAWKGIKELQLLTR
eukprot:CAMPEP_0205817376 /NCGR_PEP_ID=MMETSP0205-20121125/24215_1 /ASSEMBLY_ACC=CAM_ASM_000278 /TAXON_ID=36767 /ORGANISM="Euplotes focardii, Strain TN1" /LENGTH=138 /DNA_ID=CAMNT_0053107763 /DNA_START=402 /DNA_END=815 /DNA_ORIENTATION=+